MAIKYSAVLPNGTVATRKSDRTYTHLIATTFDGATWKVRSFAGNERLAHDRYNEFARISNSDGPYFKEVRIIPVTTA